MIDNDYSRPISGALARFARDLNADARAGRLEVVRARDGEISRVIDILLRQGLTQTVKGLAGFRGVL